MFVENPLSLIDLSLAPPHSSGRNLLGQPWRSLVRVEGAAVGAGRCLAAAAHERDGSAGGRQEGSSDSKEEGRP
jgi:hypothetical protein